jgi:Ca-activated chloride channel family protein
MRDWSLTASLVILGAAALYAAPNLSSVPATPAPTPDQPTPSPEAHTAGEDVSLSLSLDRGAVALGRTETRFLTLELGMPEVRDAEQRPLDLSVVIDNSGSMSGEKIDQAKAAAHMLVDALTPQDRFSLIVFDSEAHVVVSPTTLTNPRAVHAAISRIHDAGGTNLYAGLDLGIDNISGEGRIPRVVLLSDGQTNEGITDTGEIARRAGAAFEHGVGVSTIGLGLDFNEDLLFAIAKSGGGSYDFVEDPSQLASVFEDELQRTTALAGRQAVVDLDLGPGVERIEVLGWAARETDSGWRISLGDLPSATTRRIVARVEVSPEHTGALEVAKAEVTWLDTQGEQVAARASAKAEVTTSVAVAEASILEEVASAAAYVYGNTLSMRSSKAYAAGNAAEAENLLQESRHNLQEASGLGHAKAMGRMGDLDVQAHVQSSVNPSTTRGRRAIKEAKKLSALGYVD